MAAHGEPCHSFGNQGCQGQTTIAIVLLSGGSSDVGTSSSTYGTDAHGLTYPVPGFPAERGTRTIISFPEGRPMILYREIICLLSGRALFPLLDEE